jgi:putative membrane protein
MEKDIIKTEDLKISDKLAVERTVQAVGRSLLAWVRTSLSLIGFGFTLFKFLQYLYQEGAKELMRPQTPRNIGMFLIITGTIPLLLAIIQYLRQIKQLGKRGHLLLDPNFLAAAVVFLFGFILTLTVVLRIRFL